MMLLRILRQIVLHLAMPFRHKWREELHHNGAVTRTCRVCGYESREL